MILNRIMLALLTFWVVRYWMWLYFEFAMHGGAWFWTGPWVGITYIMLAFTPVWLLVWLPCLWHMQDANKSAAKNLTKQFYSHISKPRHVILEQNQYLRIDKKTGKAEIIDLEEKERGNN